MRLERTVLGLAVCWLAGCGSPAEDTQAPESTTAPRAPTLEVPSSQEVHLGSPRWLQREMAEPITRDTASVRSDPFLLELNAGEYLALTAEQDGGDVALLLRSPAEKVLRRIDSPTQDQGGEMIEFVATDTGVHKILVEVLGASAGHYTLGIDALRPAGEDDMRRADASDLLSRAEALRRQKGRENLEEALPLYRRAVEQHRALDGGEKLAIALERHGKASLLLGRRKEALLLYEEADALFTRHLLEDPRIAAMWNDLGVLYRYFGDPTVATLFYRRSLEYWQRQGDLAKQAQILNNLGRLSSAEGSIHRASSYYREAEERWKELGDGRRQAIALNNLGGLYTLLGEPETALSFLAEARKRLSDDDTKSLGTNLKLSGDALLQTGQLEQAVARYRGALALFQRLGDDTSFGHCLIGIARSQIQAGRFAHASQTLDEALQHFASLKDPRGRAIALHDLGIANYRAGFLDQALQHHEQALQEVRAQEDPIAQGANLFRIAQLDREQDRLEQAHEKMALAVRIVEQVRGQTHRTDLKSSFFAARHEYYDAWIDILWQLHGRSPEQGFERTALEVSERSRARGLLDSLAAIRKERPQASAHLEAQRDQLLRQLELAEHRARRLRRSGEDPRALLEQEREIHRLLDLHRQLEKDQQQPFQPPQVAPLDFEAMQSTLDDDTVLLHFDLGPQRSLVWLLHRGLLRSAELPAASELELEIRRTYAMLETSHFQLARSRSRELQKRLGTLLLEPLAPLPEAGRLLVSPEGPLHYIPFGALENPATGRLLLEDYEVVRTPSISALRSLRARSGTDSPSPERRGVLAIVADPVFDVSDPRLAAVHPGLPEPLLDNGDTQRREQEFPRLPSTAIEALEIQALLAPGQRSWLGLGFAAHREAVLEGSFRDHRILHFATHAIIHDRHPELSRLVLSRFDATGRPLEGDLRALDLSRLSTRADLVVLSACRSALGAQIHGEGLVGLTSIFFRAGARSVLVSLWSVDDVATADLMKRFYTYLLHQDLPPSSALRRAQLDLRQFPRYEAPFFWAGFVLQGDDSKDGLEISTTPPEPP